MVPGHSLRDFRHFALSLLLLISSSVLAGCGGGSSTGGTTMVSPPGWVAGPSGGLHAISATQSFMDNGVTSCSECHGADLSGGTAGVSCFGNPSGCHHGTVSGWSASPSALQNHGVTAKMAPTGSGSGFASCRICHGDDFEGGGSKVSCLGCHGGNSPHPAGPWRGSPHTHSTTEEEGNAAVCHACHASTGKKNPNNPGIPAAPAASGTPPGCFNGTMCHSVEVDVPPDDTAPPPPDDTTPSPSDDAGHPVPYIGQPHFATTVTAFAADCGACHAVSGTSPVQGAPRCTACHTSGSPLTWLNCSSCHSDPPDGDGQDYPNVAGAHDRHLGLDDGPAAVSCDTCHSGLGAGTRGHYDRAGALPGEDASRQPPAEVAFLSGFNAKSGTASFSSSNRTCSNVICHGGQRTPDWRAGAADGIDVPNACPSCHISGTTQYSSYFSGRHDRHISAFGRSASTCKRCHDAKKTSGSAHFGNLSTKAFEQPASETILSDLRYNGTGCNPRQGSLTGCHGEKKWRSHDDDDEDDDHDDD